jgi:hypothetical protein
MSSSKLSPLESRTLSSGFARRTLKNLNFIKKAADDPNVHPVTQVVNSLLGLLVFPIEKEQEFYATLSKVRFQDPSNLPLIQTTLINRLSVPSLRITKCGGCPNLGRFFKRVRNAISHKHLDFSGTDPDSRILADVKIILRDRPHKKKGTSGGPSNFDWEITLTAADLERISRYVADEVIKQGL